MSTDCVRESPKGTLALLVGAAALALGGAYYAYLVAVPFPPALARAVPVLWLAGATAGLILGATAMRADARRLPGIAGLVLNVPSVALAAIFTLAALLGD